MTTPDPPCYLFVYGTLRRSMQHPLHSLLTRHARPVGPATFQGRLYDLGDYPAARPSDTPGDQILGEVYQLHPRAQNRILRRLDEYEGPAYRRELRRIDRPDGNALTAWIYLYRDSLDRAPRIPSGDYVAYRT